MKFAPSQLLCSPPCFSPLQSSPSSFIPQSPLRCIRFIHVIITIIIIIIIIIFDLWSWFSSLYINTLNSNEERKSNIKFYTHFFFFLFNYFQKYFIKYMIVWFFFSNRKFFFLWKGVNEKLPVNHLEFISVQKTCFVSLILPVKFIVSEILMQESFNWENRLPVHYCCLLQVNNNEAVAVLKF